MMKKTFTSFVLAAALVASLGTASAMATEPTVNYAVCTVTDRTKTGEHRHNGTLYAAHSQKDGHDYHESCGVDSCTKTAANTHRQSHGRGGHKRSGRHH